VKLYGIIGCGGMGREAMPLARHTLKPEPDAKLVFVVEDGFTIEQPTVNGHPVLTLSQFLLKDAEARYFNVAIGSSIARERISNSIPPDCALPFSVIAANHVSLDNNQIGEGALICERSTITSNVTIGRHLQLNFQCHIAHDCVIGNFVTFAPGVICNGAVTIEDHAYIGAGAIIKNGSRDRPILIGRGSVIGMGAVVTKSVPAGITVVGNPARVLERGDAERHASAIASGVPKSPLAASGQLGEPPGCGPFGS
jgi:sugar O-acyltransferase (sialic acid O-acetyltransferase NeuD family)